MVSKISQNLLIYVFVSTQKKIKLFHADINNLFSFVEKLKLLELKLNISEWNALQLNNIINDGSVIL
jgi:hypothetical protein